MGRFRRITVDEGPSMWRIRPRAQGRASWIQKRTAHIKVVLSESSRVVRVLVRSTDAEQR